MRTFTRLTSIAAGGLAVAMLAACSSYPVASTPNYPAYPTSSYPVSTAPVAGMEFGRITNIEYMPVGTSAAAGPNVLGAVVGGVLGGVLGNQIGSGSGRTAATVLGGVAGAAVGSQIARNQQGVTTQAG